MGATRLYEYKCDYCGTVKVVPHDPANISYPPDGWHWISITQGHEDYISVSASGAKLLCDTCVLPLMELLGEGE